MLMKERRSAFRYPIALNASYKPSKKKSIDGGEGKTVNMSSRGLWIASEQKVKLGARLEVILEWPARLDGAIELVLVAIGRVVRTRESGFALELARYEFRTSKRKVKSVALLGQLAETAMSSSVPSGAATATARFRVPELST